MQSLKGIYKEGTMNKKDIQNKKEGHMKKMDNSIFTLDTYNTKEDKPRLLIDKLMFNTRLYFMSKFAYIVLKSRSEALKGGYGTKEWALTSRNVFNLIEDCGGKFHITGLNNIRNCKEPVVFISNHMGTLETMVFPYIIAPLKEVTFVVKESLVTHPFLGPVMRSRNPIVVSRSNSREDLQNVMSKGQELLKNGVSIIVFPQGTRKIEFVPLEFNSLGEKLAGRAGMQVIPIAIKTDFWGNGKYLKDLGPINRHKSIYMAFGTPFPVEGLGREEHKRVIEFIGSNLQKWSSSDD